MRRVLCVIALATLTVALAAQEGHPLTGTWSGDWGPQPISERVSRW